MFEVSGAGYEPHGHFSYNGGADQPPDTLRQLLRGAALASDAHIVHNESENRWHVKGDPTEGALVVAAAKAGMGKAELDRTFPCLLYTSVGAAAKLLHERRLAAQGGRQGAQERHEINVQGIEAIDVHRVAVHDGHVNLGEDVIDAQAVVAPQAVHVQTTGDGMNRVDLLDESGHTARPGATGGGVGRPGEEVGFVAQIPQADGRVIVEAVDDLSLIHI